MRINHNEYVRFRPTEKGIAIWLDHRRKIERAAGMLLQSLDVDSDGWAKAPFWEVVQVFGPHIGLGFEYPIQDFELIRKG